MLEEIRQKYPRKFASVESVFKRVRRGAKIFVGTGCGEPQFLVRSLVDFVETHPKALCDAELFQVWTLGVAPYEDKAYQGSFRHNSFFIGHNTRNAVNSGLADYTPVFLSQVPALFSKGLVPLDVALIQVSPPDTAGYVSLGVSVDIVKAAVESAAMVIAQVNTSMPRVHGDSFLHLSELDFLVPYDQPLLEYQPEMDDEIAARISRYVGQLIQDGDTLQIGYGSIANEILKKLSGKKHLGVHTELLTDGIVDLMAQGVMDNSKKSIHNGKTVAAFCMGTAQTYEFLNDNPAFEFRPIDYVNNPLVIAKNTNMTAINSALEVDLTGQATAESLGKTFYSGIGGQADFMRGAVLAPNGKTILTLESTANQGSVSRIVPFLKEGAGVTLNRGDIHYVVTEYGIAYLHGKNIRERAMALIAIAHPKFRESLIELAKTHHLIYEDQQFVVGSKGEYPEELETHRISKTGLHILLRPVKISDESLLKDFFYGLSDSTLYRRFFSMRHDMPHQRLQQFVVVDYSKSMILLATINHAEKEEVVGMGQYFINDHTHTAELAFAVRDDYQNKGIGTEIFQHLVYLAKKQGLLGFTAEVQIDNRPMLHLNEKMGFKHRRSSENGIYHAELMFAK